MFQRNTENWQARYAKLDVQHQAVVATNEKIRMEKQTIEKDFATIILQLEEMQGERDGLRFMLVGADDEQKLLFAWIVSVHQTVASLPTNRKIKALDALMAEAQESGWLEP